MAIIKSERQIEGSYIERIEERTRNIRIDTFIDEEPKIIVTRETVVYHNGEVYSSKVTKRFEVGLSDLASINKIHLVQDIADAVDKLSEIK